MWKPVYRPEPWPQYAKRKENIGVPLMEVRKKYMEEQLLFENYVSTLQTLNTMNTLSPSSGGGGKKPQPITPDVERVVWVDKYDITYDYGSGPTTYKSELYWSSQFTPPVPANGGWTWRNKDVNLGLHYVQNDPNTGEDTWRISSINTIITSDVFPISPQGTTGECPTYGPRPEDIVWTYGEPGLDLVTISPAVDARPLNYPKTAQLRFNLISGDPYESGLNDGDIFTVYGGDDSSLCEHFPTWDNALLITSSNYSFSLSTPTNVSVGSFLYFSNASGQWEMRGEGNTGNIYLSALSPGSGHHGFVGELFYSNINSKENWTGSFTPVY